MHIVATGEVRLVRIGIDGAELVLQRVRRGFLAEASMNHSAYHCDGVAAEASMVYRVPMDAFASALRVETFRNGWIRHLAQELRRARAATERSQLKTVRQRVLHYIELEGRNGQLVLSQSKKDWAKELGVTHEALYRELARMKSSRALAEHDNSLVLRGCD
jgi:CRP-like cAMP-binding protein